MKLGEIRIKDFLDRTGGEVRGRLVSDAKIRFYSADYTYLENADGSLQITHVGSRAGTASVVIKPTVDLDESLVTFFGFYSGDGAKGSESRNQPGIVSPNLSISQSEPNLIRFSVEQFRKLFPGSIRFTFSLGEDSAYFMAGAGLDDLQIYYGGAMPPAAPLAEIHPNLKENDLRYLREVRPVTGSNEQHLAFYYQHKAAMETILSEKKRLDIERAGIELSEEDKVTASLRRPFKKGARAAGGSSRADETHVGGVTGMGELFLKMLHEIESSIQSNTQESAQGLIVWNDVPSHVGEVVDVQEFFTTHNYGTINESRPIFSPATDLFGETDDGEYISGLWRLSKKILLKPELKIDPLWCYVSGLYLAEGTTGKDKMIAMFRRRVSGFAFGFTSSEDTSLELLLRAMQKLFRREDCVDSWKVKVGSQYFPELVVIGLKNGVPMLRGGESGDGKLRTMEISLEIKDWALSVAPSLRPFENKYSHVEPTGAGVARIDFTASSALCRWIFPLMIYAAFGGAVADPSTEFC